MTATSEGPLGARPLTTSIRPDHRGSVRSASLVAVDSSPSWDRALASGPGCAETSVLPGGSRLVASAVGSVLALLTCSGVGDCPAGVLTMLLPSSTIGACSTLLPGEKAVSSASEEPIRRSIRSRGSSWALR